MKLELWHKWQPYLADVTELPFGFEWYPYPNTGSDNILEPRYYAKRCTGCKKMRLISHITYLYLLDT